MKDLVEANITRLPSLIDRAAHALSSARTSAEVLESKQMAQVAYDAAKLAGRMAKAQKAHGEVMAAVHRAQADALLIEARAKMRLADEYDAAQERGEVASVGVNQHNKEGVVVSNTLQMRRDEIHEARKLRDVETADPGVTEGAVQGMLDRGEEPTKAKLKSEVINAQPKPEKSLEDNAKLRKEFRAMTDEAQEEDWVNLRLDFSDQKKRIASQRSEIADLKAQVKELASDKDLGPVVTNLRAQIASLKLKRDDAMAEAKRQEYRRKLAEKERDEAVRSLQNQEIPL